MRKSSKRKFSLKTVILIIIVLMAVIFIYMNSMATAMTSTQQSYIVLDFIYPFIEKLGLENINVIFYVRKSAHILEFAFLGFCVSLVINHISDKKYKCISLGLPICMFIALIDETIQLFSEGRAGLVSDIWIDTFGSLIGIIVFFICLYIYKLIFKKK